MKITYDELAAFVPALKLEGRKDLLHIGCGNARPGRLPACFQTGDWREIRLDIDPNVKPDVVANITDMRPVPDASVSAVWSSHCIEHLEGFEVPGALKELHRVLAPGGFALITLPDIQQVARYVAQDKADDVLYTSPAGPITPLDVLFGHQASIQRGNHFMAHRTGFTASRLARVLAEAGFADVRVLPGKSFDLWAVAVKQADAAVLSDSRPRVRF